MNIDLLLRDYEKYRLSKGIHVNTVAIEIKYIQKFNSKLLPHMNVDADNPFSRITAKHVVEFFDKECEILSDRTVSRKITIITHYFDFLAFKGLVMIDFMPKFRRRFRKLDWAIPSLTIDYNHLVEKKESILSDQSIHLRPRMMYLLLLYGLELSDIMSVKLTDVRLDENIKEIYLFVNNPTTSTDRIIHIGNGLEYEILSNSYLEASEKNSDFLLYSKVGAAYGMYNPSNMHDMMKPINEALGYSLTSSKQTMYAYIHYLIKDKHYSMEHVSELLGKPMKVTANLVKTTFERVE